MVPRLPTGERPGDVLAMDERHMVDGALEVYQAKTGAKVAMTEDYLRKHKGAESHPLDEARSGPALQGFGFVKHRPSTGGNLHGHYREASRLIRRRGSHAPPLHQ